MARKAIISAYDWAQEPGVTVSGGSWETQFPATNMLMLDVQEVAQANGSSVSFTINLGATHSIGLVHLQRLVTASTGTIRVQAGSYDSGTVNARPTDTAGVYPALLNAALGRTRVFIPTTPVNTSSVTISINAAATPLQIGYVGVCEILEMPNDMLVGNVRNVLDESNIDNVPMGSSFITLRGKRRRLDFAFGPLDESNGDLYAVEDLGVVNGKSSPVIIVKHPDDTDNLERNSVWGLITNDQPFTNAFYGFADATFQITQVI